MEQVDNSALRDFFQSEQTLCYDFRIEMLKKLQSAIEIWETKICEALKKDLNKSYQEAELTEITIVKDELRWAIKHLKKMMKDRRAKTSLATFPSRGFVHYEPLGVALIISPWNYPVNLLLCPLVGAIAAGCCATIKSSPYTPTVDAVLKEMIQSTFESNYINYVSGGREVNTALLEQKWDVIFYTGSPNVGKVVYQAAAKNLTKCILELGGKSPLIISNTADVALAAKKAAWGKILNAGQTCIAPDYTFVHQDVKEEFISLLKKEMAELLHKDLFVKIVNQKAFDRLVSLLKGDIVYGGEYDAEKHVIMPTIIDNITAEDDIMQQEIFGPIMPVMTWKEENELVRYLNSRPKPLAFYFFGKKGEFRRILRRTTSGGACYNDVIMHVSNPNIPFGGVGNSGLGRYHREESFLAFSNSRGVLQSNKHFDIKAKYPPFKGFEVIKRFL